jgi:cytochrome c553
MNRILVSLTLSVMLSGCGDITRSRNTGDPQVAAVTLAQQVCSSCHGMDGNSVSPNFPNLAGQVPAYTAAQLKGFKRHDRQDPAGFIYMWGLSRKLTEEQITGLADYYAKQSPGTISVPGDPKRIPAGAQLYTNGVPDRGVTPCSSCHGATGQGMAAFPRLAGQHYDYVVKQLNIFQKTDDRPDGAVMKTVVHDLTQDDMKNVAAYVQNLPSK